MVPPSNDPPLPPGSSPRENLEALRRRAERASDVLNGMNASAGPPPTTLPAPLSSPPPTPPSPAVPDPPSGASGGQKVWMGLGLALMTGLGTLPLLFLLWIVGVVFGVVVIAEALERTRGLAPSTYGGAFWLAVAFVVVLVFVEVITWFTPRREGERAGGCLAALLTRPLAAVLLLLLPCTLLVRCDLGGTDVPDIITTTALLCVLGYGLFVLPIAFVSLALRFARWLWRVGQRSSFGSGLVAGVGTVVGALLPTCLVCAPADPEADEEGERIGAAVERGAKILADDIDRRGLVEGSLTALTVTATVIPGTTGPWPSSVMRPCRAWCVVIASRRTASEVSMMSAIMCSVVSIILSRFTRASRSCSAECSWRLSNLMKAPRNTRASMSFWRRRSPWGPNSTGSSPPASMPRMYHVSSSRRRDA